jgi:predicted PurR-regulated permease PerM
VPRSDVPIPLLQFASVLVLLALLWWMRDVLMLTAGGVIFATALLALSEPLAAATRLSSRAALLLVVVAIAAVIGSGLWLLGDPLGRQLAELRTALPEAWRALLGWLSRNPLGSKLLELWINDGTELQVPWGRIAGAATLAITGLAFGGLTLLLGLYFALDPDLYKRGFVRLFPPVRRASIRGALDASGKALSRWLLGQGAAMLTIGVLVAAVLAALGMPLALALGLIAGLLEFIPFFGAIASGLLAVLVAFAQGPQQALYVAIAMLVVQQIEGNVLVPFLQRWAVQLPPALGLLSVVVFGVLFGVPGVMFGTPLMVVAVTLMQTLYVEEALEGRG